MGEEEERTKVQSQDLIYLHSHSHGAVDRVRVDPSVTTIPARAFDGHRKLTEVELSEGLVEIGIGAFIGSSSFLDCGNSISKINIPNSLRRINDYALCRSLRTPIRLHDGIESIGRGAFSSCIFTNFRVPPLITVIPRRMLSCVIHLFRRNYQRCDRD